MYKYVRVGWLIICIIGLAVKGCHGQNALSLSKPSAVSGKIALTYEPHVMVTKLLHWGYELVLADISDNHFMMVWEHAGSNDILVETRHDINTDVCVSIVFISTSSRVYSDWKNQVDDRKKEGFSPGVKMELAVAPNGERTLTIWRTRSP